MIMKCQASVSDLLLNIPKAKERKDRMKGRFTHVIQQRFLPACTQSDGSTNKKQSKHLCGGEGEEVKAGKDWKEEVVYEQE